MHVIHAILRTKSELTREFNALGGFGLLQSLLENSSNHFKMQFCEILNYFHRDVFMKKCCMSKRLFNEVFKFLESSNPGLRCFSALVLDEITRNMDDKSLRKFVGVADVVGIVTSLTDLSLPMDYKRNLCSALNSILNVNEELREEFVKPANLTPVVALLSLAAESELELRAPGTFDQYGDTWWLAATLAAVIGTASGGSKERQDIVGQHPELLATLIKLNSWFPGGFMGAATASSLYKCCARSLDNIKQLVAGKAAAISVLLDCFDADFPEPFSNRDQILTWSTAAALVGGCCSVAEFRPCLSKALQKRLFGVHEKLVKVLDGSRSPTLCFDQLQRVFNYTNAVTLMRLDDQTAQLAWMLRCCTCRSSRGSPYLTVMSEHIARRTKYILPEAFMATLDPFMRCLLLRVEEELKRLELYKHSLSPELQGDYFWAAMRLQTAPLMESVLASMRHPSHGSGLGEADSSLDAKHAVEETERSEVSGQCRNGKHSEYS